MTALGPCSNLNSSVSLVVNEVTTVASLWPLARFIGTSYANVGSSNSNYNSGFANAFATVNNLVNITTGQPLTYTPGGSEFTPLGPSGTNSVSTGLAPLAEINTLADAIDTCAASTGGIPGDGSPCDLFFAAANSNPLGGIPNTGNEPTSILQALIEEAQYPAKSGEIGSGSVTGTALFNLIPASGYPFSPILPAAPSDWTLALSFTGGGLEGLKQAAAGSSSLAVDRTGNVWISNRGISSVSELTNLGVALSPYATGYKRGQGGGFIGGGLNSPLQLAVDQNGDVWVLNANSGSGSTLTELDFTGTPVNCPASPYCGGSSASSPYTGAGNLGNSGDSLVVDGSGNIWVTESGSPGDVAEYAGFNGVLLNGTKIENGGAISPAGSGYINLTSSTDPLDTSPADPSGGLGIDDSGDVWLLDGDNDSAVELSSSGALKEVDHGFATIDPTSGQPSGPVLGTTTFGETLTIDRGGDIFIPQSSDGQQIYELYACKSSADPNCLGLGTTTVNVFNPYFQTPVTMDGSQDLWITSASCESCNAQGGPIPGALVRISPSGALLNVNDSTPQTGYVAPCFIDGCQPATDGTLNGIALDSSGNAWLLLLQPGSPVSVVEFVGVATPVITPASSALTAGKIAQAP
jgi:hypothetical protein